MLKSMTLTCRSDLSLPYYGYYEAGVHTVIREPVDTQGIAGSYYGYYGITNRNTHIYIREKNYKNTRVRARKVYSDTVISVISVIRDLEALKNKALKNYGVGRHTVIHRNKCEVKA